MCISAFPKCFHLCLISSRILLSFFSSLFFLHTFYGGRFLSFPSVRPPHECYAKKREKNFSFEKKMFRIYFLFAKWNKEEEGKMKVSRKIADKNCSVRKLCSPSFFFHSVHFSFPVFQQLLPKRRKKIAPPIYNFLRFPFKKQTFLFEQTMFFDNFHTKFEIAIKINTRFRRIISSFCLSLI